MPLFLLNPRARKTTKKKATKKRAAGSKRRPAAAAKPKKRRPKAKGGRSMAKATKRRRKKPVKRRAAKRKPARRKAASRKKKYVRRKKARRNPVRRRKPAAKKRRRVKRRKAPVRRRRRPAAKKRRVYKRRARRNPTKRKKTRRKASRGRKLFGRSKAWSASHFKLQSILPNIGELQSVGLAAVSVLGGWGLSSALVGFLEGSNLGSPAGKAEGRIHKLLYQMGIPPGGHAEFAAEQVVDVASSFFVAGVTGFIFKSPKTRDLMLLGGLVRVAFHTANYVAGRMGNGGLSFKRYFLRDAYDEGMGDWITQSDMPGQLSGPMSSPAMADYISTRNMPQAVNI